MSFRIGKWVKEENEHAHHQEALYLQNGKLVAVIDDFTYAVYANAVNAEGITVRSGACRTIGDAKEWAERVTGTQYISASE